MVKPVTAFGRSGLHDWYVQRLSALVLAAYVLTLLGWAMVQGLSTDTGVDYMSWRDLFSCLPFKIFSLLSLLALTAHAWVGMWTIMTDYVKPMAARFMAQSIIILMALSVLLWGVTILWSV